jgi:hypothetical protein
MVLDPNGAAGLMVGLFIEGQKARPDPNASRPQCFTTPMLHDPNASSRRQTRISTGPISGGGAFTFTTDILKSLEQNSG